MRIALLHPLSFGLDAAGPAAAEGGFIPLQYLELVKIDSVEQVENGDDAGGAPDAHVSPPGTLSSASRAPGSSSSRFGFERPPVRFAGGGFVKSRPGREPNQEDYLELLRVAEVLDALNQVEGNVLQQRSQDLLSYEEYLNLSQAQQASAAG
eukprot:SAG31_NODE_22047_length_535_cov_0.825688_1_plen_151_part_10